MKRVCEKQDRHRRADLLGESGGVVGCFIILLLQPSSQMRAKKVMSSAKRSTPHNLLCFHTPHHTIASLCCTHHTPHTTTPHHTLATRCCCTCTLNTTQLALLPHTTPSHHFAAHTTHHTLPHHTTPHTATLSQRVAAAPARLAVFAGAVARAPNRRWTTAGPGPACWRWWQEQWWHTCGWSSREEKLERGRRRTRRQGEEQGVKKEVGRATQQESQQESQQQEHEPKQQR